MNKNGTKDLAFIIHGVVIANGFWKLGELVWKAQWLNVSQVICVLIIAIMD
ncbi:MAG: hypothetical protein GXO57_09170, partial [Thermodesulfobacteria bacterium]|nr:hypothetical protein [Thermodesulfobacteriota bacterium]